MPSRSDRAVCRECSRRRAEPISQIVPPINIGNGYRLRATTSYCNVPVKSPRQPMRPRLRAHLGTSHQAAAMRPGAIESPSSCHETMRDRAELDELGRAPTTLNTFIRLALSMAATVESDFCYDILRDDAD